MIKLTFLEHIIIFVFTTIECFVLICVFFVIYKIFDYSVSFEQFYTEGLAIYILIQFNLLNYLVYKTNKKNNK